MSDDKQTPGESDADLDTQLRNFERETIAIADRADQEPAAALEQIGSLTAAFRKARIESSHGPQLLINMTSVLINIAGDLADEEALRFAIDALDELLALAVPEDEWTSQATYNRANARDHLIQAQTGRVWTETAEDRRRDAYFQARAAERLDLRLARADFLAAAEAANSDYVTQARTNLGNTLSTSGRWLEAFEQYALAVAADPTNGNAAGNAALSLMRALQARLGPAGHLAAVYEKYRAMALANRTRTVELAGEETAARWDALPEIESRGHLAHANAEDPYIAWVAREKLALTPVMDGLGSDSPHFDDVAIESITTGIDEADMPMVFAAANVLKADFLAARSTVYRGLSMLDESAGGWALHDRDTGTYANTLDYAVYGEAISLLTLGARAALDVLDKIAVAANEYLGTGDDPGKINFRAYWFAKKTKQAPWPALRSELTAGDADMQRVLALAELADDLEDGGLYERAQMVRNRSTHRLVRAKVLDAESVTAGALTTLALDDLQSGSVQSLRVARAAILYFHALVASTERLKAERADGIHVPLVIPPFE